MDSQYNVADAKARFSELIDRAAAGEEIEIRKRGEPVARLVPVRKPRKPIDVNALKALTDKMKDHGTSAGDFVRDMRDSDRY